MIKLSSLLTEEYSKDWKAYMAAIFLTLGSIFIPLAFYVLIEVKNVFIALLALSVGSIFGGLALKFTWDNEKQSRKEGMVTLYILTSIAEKMGVNIEEALKKIKAHINGK